VTFGDVLYHEGAPDEIICFQPKPYSFLSCPTVQRDETSLRRPWLQERRLRSDLDEGKRCRAGPTESCFLPWPRSSRRRGCGSSSRARASEGDAGAPDANDPDPVLTADERAALSALSPGSLPPPPADPTNRMADNPSAAALGQRLFYDRSFAGHPARRRQRREPSHIGTPGQTQRVACADCHLPAGAFSDTRSFQRQISLGTGWGRRRAPSLLDVGQTKLIMWDGRRDALYNQVFGPLESVVEMNSSRLFMAEKIFQRHKPQYEAVFGPMPPLDDAGQFPALSVQLTGCQPKILSGPRTGLRRNVSR